MGRPVNRDGAQPRRHVHPRDGASIQGTKAVYEKINAIIEKEPGIRTYNGVAGFSFFTRTAASYTGTGFIGLKPWDERKSPAYVSRDPEAAQCRLPGHP